MIGLRSNVRSRLIVPVLWASLASGAIAATLPETGEKIVEASIDNHGALVVRYMEGDLGHITIESISSNGTKKIYTWSRDEGSVVVKEADREEVFRDGGDSEEYRENLRKIRDLISYAAGPERYDWLVFGSTLVRPELNSLIDTIDEALGVKTENDVNCQLLIEAEGQSPIIVSGGAFGELGEKSQHVTKVWVKKGYTLVLVSNAFFETSGDVKLVRVVGDERRAKTELPKTDYDNRLSDLVESSDGTTYNISGTLMEGSVRSFICRPDVRG